MEFSLIDYTGFLVISTAIFFWITYRLLREQGNYFKATTRPFVGVEVHSYTHIKYPEKTTNLDYEIKNYGNTPAKDVQFKSEFFDKENPEHKLVFNKEYHIYSIYPNISFITPGETLPVIYNNKNKSYLHIAITYKDMAENTYNTLEIFLFTTNVNKPDKLEPFNSIFN